MKMIIGENISKIYVEKQLLHNVSFSIQEKERVGLIGVNGTGKSTFLKIVASKESADEGTITTSSDYKISFLSQKPNLDQNLSIMEQVLDENTSINNIIKSYESCLSKIQEDPMNEKIQSDLMHYQQQMDSLNAWDHSSNAKAVLNKLGIEDVTVKVGQLSGGQKKRVALAQTLLQNPDLLILDEPTNHLDFETIMWLEDYLNKFTGALLLVTHDRYFLDKVTTKIFELHNGHLYTYLGNYASYLEAKAIRMEELEKTETKQKSLYRQELEWMRKGAKARTTKQKARIQRFEKLEENVKVNNEKTQLEMVTAGTQRLGKKVLELKDVSVTFNNKVILKNIDLLLKQKDRIGIVGPNGAGKSTLLNVLASKLVPSAGELEKGQTVKIGYYTQEQEDMNGEQRIIEYIKEEAEVVHTEDGQMISASQLLERFLFPPHSHGTPIRKLSGGEKKRLYLLKILMSQPNVLLLDEPTNDLDTETLTILEAYLEEFPGVVVTVSHDRYFLDKVVTELLILDGSGTARRIFGEYSDYLLGQQAKKQLEKKEAVKSVEQPIRLEKKQLRLSFQEQKDWETIEERIADLEIELERISKEIEKAGSDYGKISELMESQNMKSEQLEALMKRWEELSVKVEAIQAQKAGSK
ncbi:ABC-F family ATP-binding cassette domain-containing protein [Sutcliffiella cohnii]|uniref:ABC-F family ATP-binding cassette domain-containing protein n=1 Tax=Sutcliffiella cohnii TaxID=33932 RepID=UPI002E1E7509|nr:ABC-F family ATP-binding cassette domain-containing protein [Sutcliffiella cohnii]